MLKDRLRNARIRANLTLDEVAKKVGVSRQTIHRYETGIINNVPSDNIEKIALALNTTPAELMGWKNFETPSSTKQKPLQNEHPLDEIPVLLTISYSHQIYDYENLVGYIGLSEKNIADFALPMPDNSMINANILPHDIVLVKQQSQVEDGQIACILVKKSTIIRKFYFHSQGIELRPANCDIKSSFFFHEDCDNIQVLGLVVGWLHMNNSPSSSATT